MKHLLHTIKHYTREFYYTALYELVYKKKYPLMHDYFVREGRGGKKEIRDELIKMHALVSPEPQVLAKFFIEHKKKFMDSSSLLNIGIGFETPPDWLTFFRDIFQYSAVGSLEIWKQYMKIWQYHKDFPVWYGDVRDVARLLPPKSVDTILWAHGPEHLPTEDFMQTYLDIKKVARKHILFVTPWGNAYDYQEDVHDNPYETHVIKSPDKTIYKGTGLKIITWGKKDTGDGGMLAYEFL